MKWNRIVLTAAVCVFSGLCQADDPMGTPCGQSAQQTHNSEGILQQLEKLQEPIHVRVSDCNEELELAQCALKSAIAERDAACADMQLAIERISAGGKLLKSMCSTICIGGELYSKEDVAGALKSLICDYLAAKQVHDIRQKTVAERKTSLQAVEVRVAKWQKAERDLLKEISLLKAEHDLSVAQQEQPSTSDSVDTTEVVKAERLLKEISGLLTVQVTSVTTTVAKPAAETVPTVAPVSSETLIEEVDQILNQNK